MKLINGIPVHTVHSTHLAGWIEYRAMFNLPHVFAIQLRMNVATAEIIARLFRHIDNATLTQDTCVLYTSWARASAHGGCPRSKHAVSRIYIIDKRSIPSSDRRGNVDSALSKSVASLLGSLRPRAERPPHIRPWRQLPRPGGEYSAFWRSGELE